MAHSAQASFSTWCLEEGASNEESEPKKVSFERQIGLFRPALNLTFVEQAPRISVCFFRVQLEPTWDCCCFLPGFWQTPRRYHWRYGLSFRWRCQWGVWATRCRQGEDPNGSDGIIGFCNKVMVYIYWQEDVERFGFQTRPLLTRDTLAYIYIYMYFLKALFWQENPKKTCKNFCPNLFKCGHRQVKLTFQTFGSAFDHRHSVRPSLMCWTSYGLLWNLDLSGAEQPEIQRPEATNVVGVNDRLPVA